MGFTRDSPIVAGTVLIRSDIRSQNYVSGVSGWIIEADGDAEFSNVMVRGTFVATGDNNAYIEVASQPIPQIIFQPPDYVPGPPFHAELAAGAIYVYNNGDVREIMLFDGPHFNLGGGAATNVYPQLYLASPRYDGSAGSEIFMNSSDGLGNLLLTVEGNETVTKDLNVLGALAVLGNITGLSSVFLDPGNGSRDTGRGFLASDRRTTTSGAVGPAEAVAWTFTSRTYYANRAYELRINQGVAAATAGSWIEGRVRKTNAAGQLLGDVYRTPGQVAGQFYAGGGTVTFVVGGSNVTASLVVTLETNAGTATIFGSASPSGAVAKFYDVGAAADFIAADANIAVLV